jgi:HNH endonuclease
MSHYIPDSIRRQVAKRANYCCEYCILPDSRSFFTFHIDHIISLKHDGSDSIDNLAYACQICNLNKGSDIATVFSDISKPIRFYNPRIDNWKSHFSVDSSGMLIGQSDIALATIKIFDFNHPDSIIERLEMLKHGLI